MVEDAAQLHEVKAKVLEFATVNDPVMYIGIPFVDADALKFDPSTINDALFLIEKFTSITILA